MRTEPQLLARINAIAGERTRLYRRVADAPELAKAMQQEFEDLDIEIQRLYAEVRIIRTQRAHPGRSPAVNRDAVVASVLDSLRRSWIWSPYRGSRAAF